MALPTTAWLPGKGRVRILEQLGPHRFIVLTKRDEHVIAKRDDLVFTKGRA